MSELVVTDKTSSFLDLSRTFWVTVFSTEDSDEVNARHGFILQGLEHLLTLPSWLVTVYQPEVQCVCHCWQYRSGSGMYDIIPV